MIQKNGWILQYSTEHYLFYCHEGSLAQREIREIAAVQEACFERITRQLKITFPVRLEYYLCNTPEEVGQIYGDNEPCNGFARVPNQIYAVYSEAVRCIGAHEDAHMLSYQINRPACAFLREGIAMYFDEVWWSHPNALWSKLYLEIGKLPRLQDLLEDDFFYALDCWVTYPIAGSFVAWVIEHWSQEHFLEIYRGQRDYGTLLEQVLNDSLAQIDEQFRQFLSGLLLEEKERSAMEESLAAE